MEQHEELCNRVSHNKIAQSSYIIINEGGEVLPLEPEAVAVRMEPFPDSKFRRCVFGSDTGHYLVTNFRRDGVGHGVNSALTKRSACSFRFLLQDEKQF